MRKLVACFLFLCCTVAEAQVYNNEWIDFSKTYYRFRVGRTGVYRITGATLAANGLGSVDASHFQLWRHGVQIPVFTSVPSGPLAAADYIEFWGEMNDGKPDKELYRDPRFQLSDKFSLLTDSATYFLTANTAGANRRLQPTPNNVAGNTLAPEPFFLHTRGHYFRDKISQGLFYIVGTDHLFSSAYDQNEGWTSADIVTGGRNLNQVPTYGRLTSNQFSNLFAAPAGPDPVLKVVASGNAWVTRRVRVAVNNDSVMEVALPHLDFTESETTIPLAVAVADNPAISITNMSDVCTGPPCELNDRLVVHKIELTYPRRFNFGGATNFTFQLPASASGNYLEIDNLSHNSEPPVLYDLTNGKRYVGQLVSGQVRVVLEPSATERSLVLVSQAAANIAAVTTLQPRNFVNYSLPANQGNYLIVSNPLLFNGAGGTNPVEEYRAYRASAQGGSYNAKIYLEEELTDQFGFGIKKNPAGVRNFIRFANNRFASKPRHVFLVGRGTNYLSQRSVYDAGTASQKANLERLNMVPTFGWPASDMLLAAEPGAATPSVPIGRLTAVTPAEVSIYLKKVREYEAAQQSVSPLISEKAWMKNIAHLAGAGEEPLASFLIGYFRAYERIIEDSLWGANVAFFTKKTTNTVEQLNDADLVRMFNEGLSLITYYGHSSPTSLEFNLDDPANYNNPGKYPMFLALGCAAANTFDFNEGRFATRNYLSDKFVLAPDRGSINFIGSSHFGIVHYLDIWNARAYTNMAKTLYGASIGDIMKKTIDDVYRDVSTEDFMARCNAEETILNGDPAVKMNQPAVPDYTITEEMIKISPVFVSVADQSFRVTVQTMNLGKAIGGNVVIETKREYPDRTTEVIRRDTIRGIRYMDSVSFRVPIDAIRDRGTNKLTVTVDAPNAIAEQFETNNVATREFVVFDEEARPIYPQEFTIVNQPNITLKASTANPFGEAKQYRMEMDTTAQFNSPVKTASTITSRGGLLEFQPGMAFANNTVYYWRVGPVQNGSVQNWNGASFLYLPNGGNGYNQSHYFQHTKSTGRQLTLEPSSRQWRFDSVFHNLTMRNGVFGTSTGQEGDLTVAVDGNRFIRSACVGLSLIFNLFDPNSLNPRRNTTGQYGSALVCQPGRQWNFEYSYGSVASRKRIMDFMDSIPAGTIVVVRNIINGGHPDVFINQWLADTALYGSGVSLYHKLKQVGFDGLDSFNRSRVFSFVYRKENPSFTPTWMFSDGRFDVLNHSVNIMTPDSIGRLVSPEFGPAKAWKQLQWAGRSVEAVSTDNATLSVVGITAAGRIDTLMRGIGLSQPVVDVSAISAATYPNLQLVMRTSDSLNFSPYQLDYWRVTYDPVPEGALAPNIYLQVRDTVDVGEPFGLRIAFRNITDSPFEDSMRVRVQVTDRNNVTRTFTIPRFKRLPANDTLTVTFDLPTENLVGLNNLFFDVNPANEQPEQFRFNNFAYRNFYVRGDTLNPLLDVTFDNVRILNRDIVSAKPDILIKLKDEAKWMLLNDTAVAKVQVRFPSGAIRTYHYNSDTLQFTPATGSGPNDKNVASISLRPHFAEDGEYELIVTGRDRSNNGAGPMAYRVAFQVFNKPMISNMLNYPNPFTTSTAFVFTLTGSEVPQNLRIQILTVTGKVVREITKDELGPLRIGRNITEFKWDGTDQYGQALANGVYLYRVITNLNGKSLEKFRTTENDTDKYFNKGYGKMYLMR